jgi:hypothetical protein
MALPTSRNRNYADGVVVEPSDLDDFQDAIIGGKHGQIRYVIPAIVGHSQNGAFSDLPQWGLGAGDDLVIAVPVIVGMRLYDLNVQSAIVSTDTDVVAFQLFNRGVSVGSPANTTTGDLDPHSDAADLGSVPIAITVNHNLGVVLSADGGNSGNVNIFAIDFLVDKP